VTTGENPGARPARPSAHGLPQLVRLPGLRRLLISRLLAAIGDGAFQGAVAGAILFDPTRQTTAAEVAAGFAVLLIPYSLIGPFAGALLDRWSRRHVLFWSNLTRAAIAAVLAILLIGGSPLWVTFVVALLITGSGRFVGSGLSAAMPHVVASDSLVGANSLASTIGSIASVLGGAVALGVRGVLGQGNGPTALSVSCVMLFYAASAVVVGRFARNDLGPDETDEPPQPIRAVLQGFAAGVRHSIERPTIGLNIATVMIVRLCVGACSITALLLFRYYFHTGIKGVLEVLGVAGIGLFVGAVTTAPLVALVGRNRYVVILLATVGVLVPVTGAAFSQWTTMAAAIILAFTYQSSKICADTVVQTDSDDAHIGRVFALYDTSNNVFYVAGFAVMVPLLPPDGHSLPPVVIVGFILILVAVFYWWGMRTWVRPSESR
jgi:MFS family permease